MLLTFIIPSFNRAHCVGRAIESVLVQRRLFPHGFEIVVVDDGSTDTTSDVLGKYTGDAAVTVIRLERNRGLAHARNAGFERAKGRWCAMLDSDNALLPNVATEIERVLLSMDNGIGVVWADSQDSAGRRTIAHDRSGRISGIETLTRPLNGEHFPIIRIDIARANRYAELAARHACEPAFWAALARVTDFWVERQAFQYYETTGSDRFCALETRISGAKDLAACYRYTSEIVAGITPRYHWELRGKAAFYRSIDGDWLGSIGEALGALKGLQYSRQNFAIMLSCLAGPWASRRLLRYRSR
jgi:glycosyltransferase involved in cell wall biosynthesis